MKIVLTAFAVVAFSGIANAQHQHRHGGSSPYAANQNRSIKALSAEQVSDLRAGRGMGFALAAELNGYPGPLHVLELADKLALSADVRSRMRADFEAMKAEAVPVGESLIASEAALDRAFADRSISPETLAKLTEDIGATQGRLRAIHLKYHLGTAEMLTAHQREQYAVLRGYR